MNEVHRFAFDGLAFFVVQNDDGTFSGLFFNRVANDCPTLEVAFNYEDDPVEDSTSWPSIEEASNSIVEKYKADWLRENPHERHRWN